MTGPQDRMRVLDLVNEAVAAGARLKQACAVLGVSARTVQRWTLDGGHDGRAEATRPPPSNALSPAERERALALLCSQTWRDLSPKQIVPRLADEGVYIASESTLYRLLREARLGAHRGRARAPTPREPRRHEAHAPNTVWSWDISYLPSAVRGQFYYLYMVSDVYSRKLVAWQVHLSEDSEHAAALIRQACLDEGVEPEQLVPHSDNGAPMKGITLLAMLQVLGVTPSFSRPRVSNDNPYSESLFRTVKYRPWYPQRPFSSMLEAREWVATFVHWYNDEHRHQCHPFRHTQRATYGS